MSKEIRQMIDKVKNFKQFVNEEVEKENKTDGKSKYLVALPAFRGSKGFNHQTILVSAKDEDDARDIARHLKPHSNIGDIKKVDY